MPTAPKDPIENLRYRREIHRLGAENKLAREEILLAASRDVVWFIDTFLFGYNPKDHPTAPERPFITYPFQEDVSRRIAGAIGVHDLVIPKSRAVGGTYIILANLFQRWLFCPMQSFLLASAKEDRVDSYGDPSCLFWKIDHFLGCLPNWMKPTFDRVELRIENLSNGSVINGESTNSNIDRGGRRTAILADEAATMREAHKISSSIQYVTNSCLWLSTFQGAFGGFYDLYEKYSREHPDWVIKLHWTQHPVYSQGLYLGPDGKPRSPWYDIQCARASGPRFIAQELDMDAMAAGGQFFENDLLGRLLGPNGTMRSPVGRGELRYSPEDAQNFAWTPDNHGRLLIWCPLDGYGLPPAGDYVIGCDIATGKGGEKSSQSAASVVNKATGEKVAEFKYGLITPTNFGKYVVALARWFHGAKIIWGSQGLGDFGITITRDLRYASVFRRPDGKPGFPENADSKLSLLGMYREALASGRFVNRSKEALEECRQFIYANNTVEHSRAIQNDQDPENKGRLHGDIVVADAMANHLLPLNATMTKKAAAEAEYGSFAWRMKEAEKQYREKDEWAPSETTRW